MLSNSPSLSITNNPSVPPPLAGWPSPTSPAAGKSLLASPAESAFRNRCTRSSLFFADPDSPTLPAVCAASNASMVRWSAECDILGASSSALSSPPRSSPPKRVCVLLPPPPSGSGRGTTPQSAKSTSLRKVHTSGAANDPKQTTRIPSSSSSSSPCPLLLLLISSSSPSWSLQVSRRLRLFLPAELTALLFPPLPNKSLASSRTWLTAYDRASASTDDNRT